MLMNAKIEIIIEVIVHATEDISKIFQSFEILNIKEEEFTVNEISGHYDNPIKMLKARIVKKEADEFIKKFVNILSPEQINKIIEEIKERTIDSRLHLRLDKQELIGGNITMTEKDSIKLKIHTPIYNKKDTVRSFTEIFQIAN